jgi:hypothetical protein
VDAAAEAAPLAPPAPVEPPLPVPVFSEATPAPDPSPWPGVQITSPARDALVPAEKAPDLEIRWKLASWKLEAGRRLRFVLDNRVTADVSELGHKVLLRDLDPAPLAPGQHVLVALLLGPSGESVKASGKRRAPVAVTPFFVGARTPAPWKAGSPMLVYTGPLAGPAPAEGVLVDFVVVNAELGESYSVHASITGPGLKVGEAIHTWKPWRIHDARPGSYTASLELWHFAHELGESSSSTTVIAKPVPVEGPWGAVTRDVDVAAPTP